MRHARLAILASTALTLAGAAQSHAADWSGFYVGGNIGYSWGGKVTSDLSPFTVPAVPGVFDTFVVPGDTFRLKPDGVIGGGQLGQNWQSGTWVFGIETDLQASGQKDTDQRTRFFFDIDCSSTCDAISSTAITAKLSWFGTLRGRIGQDFSGLFGYLTGGLAYGEVKISGNDTISVDEGQDGDIDAVFQRSFAYTKTKVGWTIGAGVEGQTTWSNWTWRIEYLYIDLGNVNYSDANFTVNSSVTDNILRFALNYRFAPPPPP
ncbi:MAG: porin family protein [Pseudorhodoplanes sp.]|jgi:outer membrane immunogenic protein|nr:porin family protein [Pseudorhodoplanes sp.]